MGDLLIKKTNRLTFKNYAELMQYRAIHNKNNILYTFLKDGEAEEECLTFDTLYEASRQIAATLQTQFLPKERVILLFPAGLDFIKTFIGCVLANIIPIPLSLPRQRQSDMNYIQNVAKQASICSLLTLFNINQRFQLNELLPTTQIINVDQILLSSNNLFTPIEIHENDIAFLQYTSGSTGMPKGIMVSHANLLHNQQLIKSCYDVSEESIFMSWLPHYHDMGLIGTLLHQIYSGCQTVLMSPTAFLQKPFRWLSAISKYKATISGAPNFAYELCIKRISEEQKKSLDLSHWKIAFNGAEKVSAETLKKFSESFTECGFNFNQFFPTYGLAESTLLVSGGEISADPIFITVDSKQLENNKLNHINADHPNAQQIVSSGKRCLDLEISIVNSSTHELSNSDEVGEIWLKGASVALGYWNNLEKTKEQFNAYLTTGEGPYFRTGDIGFMHEGNLFITGRIKDLIIIRGRNIYPDDIELAAQSVDNALRLGHGAAFSIEIAGEEQLFLVQEVDRTSLKYIDTNSIFKKISNAIINKFDLQIYGMVLIMPQTLLKTTSGKIRRNENKKLFLNNELVCVASWSFDSKKTNTINS